MVNFTTIFHVGPKLAGKTPSLKLFSASGVQQGSTITAGFTELGTLGEYLFQSSTWDTTLTGYGQLFLDGAYAVSFAIEAPPEAESEDPGVGLACTLTLALASGGPVADAEIWVSTDEAGEQLVQSGRTDSFGSWPLRLTAGDYFRGSRKTGVDFVNPQPFTVVLAVEPQVFPFTDAVAASGDVSPAGPCLATLADLRRDIGMVEHTADALLCDCLLSASAAAETLAGRPLRREVGRVEYPDCSPNVLARLSPDLLPIESVADVRQLYTPGGSDVDFDNADALVEGVDYVVDRRGGALIRRSAAWYIDARALRLTYTAGMIDPLVGGAAPAWTNGTSYSVGTLVRFQGGLYAALQPAVAASGTNDPTLPAFWAPVAEVPPGLQAAVRAEAWRRFNLRNIGNVNSISAGGVTVTPGSGGGGDEGPYHADLVAACKRLRRIIL